MRVACVVDKHVHAAPLIDRALHHCFDLGFLGDVYRQRHCRFAPTGDFIRHPLGAGQVHIRQQHPRTLGREPLGNRLSEPGASPRHDHPLTVEPHSSLSLLNA
jgi:hypothetical protein